MPGQTSARPALIRKGKRLASYAILGVIGPSMLVPFLWMVRSSLMAKVEIFGHPIKWLPRPPRFGNSKAAWEAVPFARFYLNSFLIAVSITGGQVLTSAMAAYAFARLRFPGRDQIF